MHVQSAVIRAPRKAPNEELRHLFAHPLAFEAIQTLYYGYYELRGYKSSDWFYTSCKSHHGRSCSSD
jgi:hypothetical protein